jgi:S-DNA-T family DNA segregation ATPase FtsK/SpoIIIE
MKVIKEYKTPKANDVNAELVDMLQRGHVLIAGTSGAGKSVLLNNLIYNAIAVHTPADAEYIFIDPKRVELSIYAALPHTIARVTSHQAAAATVSKLLDVVRERFDDMEKRGLKKYDGKTIYVFIDEIADLLTGDAGKEFSAALRNLLQIARAAGVFVVACTQCPNRKIIPAEIVCNFQTRVALRCLSAIESRQIINARGAEDIREYGKAIMLNNRGYGELTFSEISDQDIKARVNYWKTAKPEIYIKL